MSAAFAHLAALHEPHVVLWLAAPLLACAGVSFIARNEVFAGAALSQSAVLGAVLAATVLPSIGLRHLPWLSHPHIETIVTIAFATATAFALRRASARATFDADAAWIIVAGASVAGLCASSRTHASEALRDLLLSAHTTADPSYVLVLLLLLGAAGWAVRSRRRELTLLAIDERIADAVGVRVGAWSFALALTLGMTVGISVRATGFLYTFAGLALPAMAARHACREISATFWVSPALAMIATAVGVYADRRYEISAQQAVVLFECALVLAAWAAGGFARRRARRSASPLPG